MSKSRPVPKITLLGDGALCCSPLAREPLDVDQAERSAALLKAVADPVRLRMLSLVMAHADREACVCDLTDEFDLSQPTVSHHLKVLHEAGVLDREKRGVWVYYRVRDDALRALADLFTVDAATVDTAAVGAPAVDA